MAAQLEGNGSPPEHHPFPFHHRFNNHHQDAHISEEEEEEAKSSPLSTPEEEEKALPEASPELEPRQGFQEAVLEEEHQVVLVAPERKVEEHAAVPSMESLKRPAPASPPAPAKRRRKPDGKC